MVGVCGTEAIPQESVATVTEKEAALGSLYQRVQRETMESSLFSSLPCRVIRSWIQSLQSHRKSGWPVWKWKGQRWLVPLEMEGWESKGSDFCASGELPSLQSNFLDRQLFLLLASSFFMTQLDGLKIVRLSLKLSLCLKLDCKALPTKFTWDKITCYTVLAA